MTLNIWSLMVTVPNEQDELHVCLTLDSINYLRVIYRFITFNGMSLCFGLYYPLKVENPVHSFCRYFNFFSHSPIESGLFSVRSIGPLEGPYHLEWIWK